MNYNNGQQVFILHVIFKKPLAYHISTRIMMYHVSKARVGIIRHVTAVIRHPHINISCNKCESSSY